jgi:hypothetical protein
LRTGLYGGFSGLAPRDCVSRPGSCYFPSRGSFYQSFPFDLVLSASSVAAKDPTKVRICLYFMPIGIPDGASGVINYSGQPIGVFLRSGACGGKPLAADSAWIA